MKIGKIITRDWFDTVCFFMIPFILGVIITDASWRHQKPGLEDCAVICKTEFENYGC